MDIGQIGQRIRAHSDADGFDAEAVQIVAALIQRVREAQSLIEVQGPIWLDHHGNPQEHPAVKVERQASAEIRGWVKDRPDLFGEKKQAGPKREKFTGFKAV